jgi:hypothetical protein
MPKVLKRRLLGNKSKKQKDWGFSRGVIAKKDRVYVLSFMSDREGGQDLVTQVLRWTGEWGSWLIEWSTAAICVTDTPVFQVLCMGNGGRIQVGSASGFSEESVDDSKEGPPHRGMLRDMRLIGKHFYAAGMGRQVYKRAAPGKWIRADGGVLAPRGKAKGLGFESIDGFTEESILAVGWRGEIWHFDGRRWQQEASPTNVILNRVLCAPDGNAYVCGQAGVLVRGKPGKWELVEHDVTEDNFWGMTWFQGRLWLATLDGLYRLADAGRLEPVSMGEGDPLTCGWLDANDGVLWSIGAEDLAFYDGEVWTEVILE